MSIWIVTTGNSDVQLTTDEHWVDLYDAAVEEEDSSILEDCEDLRPAPQQDRATGLYPAPARALGLVYRAECLDDYYEDLTFPLLNTFVQGIENLPESECPSQIIVLLTDQTQIFTAKQKQFIDCPFWQDTVDLRDILTRYFQNQEKLGIVPKFYCITPAPAQDKAQTATAGADNWEYMLKKVNETLERALSELGVNREEETVYVSHQAGAPAISSAVQFLTVSKFQNVKFLVSNQYYQGYNRVSSHQVIPSSNYWRGLQVEKAKRLIQNGQPGAALKLLEGIPEIEKIVTPKGKPVISRLKRLVDLLNFKAVGPQDLEFNPFAAIKRVRRSLDLAELFIASENYLPGVNLLAAAHETFLKAAILYKLEQNNAVLDGFQVSRLVRWNSEGFCLQPKKDLKDKGFLIPKNSEDLSKALKFPAPEESIDSKKNKLDRSRSSGDYDKWWEYLGRQERFTLDCVSDNKYFELNESRLRKWLLNLEKFQEWYLMKWSCTHFRTKKLDLRNQNMHNLLGVERLDVIRYFLGNPNDPKIPRIDQEAKNAYEDYENRKNSLKVKDVIDVYREYFQTPFVEALKCFGLDDTVLQYTPLPKELEELAKALEV